ncbi:MAG: class I SAM-dependent methyltransferase, partial [Chloroflexota bacterium]
AGAAALLYWLLVITEGVYLGRRVVVWLYDITAHKYDGIKEFDAGAEQFFVIKPYLKHLPVQPAPLLLDVATGTGRVPYYLLKEPFFNGRVYGVDASWRMLVRADEKLRGYNGRCAFIQQVAEKLPFPDNTFHGVSCLESLEFFPSDKKALREFVRVLRPGGSLMVTRRQGWEAKTFFGRYHSQDDFAILLRSLGLVEVVTLAWQVDYDLVLARKPGEQETVNGKQ